MKGRSRGIALSLTICALGCAVDARAMSAETVAARSGLQASCTVRCAFKDGPSGSQCVAPAYVHVDCIGDGANETRSGDPDVRPFHDLSYKIDYGDEACSSGQGNWEYGGEFPHSKNVDYGPLGAHIYECAGPKTITTTVMNALGQISTTQDQVTIIAEDAGWTAANTRCVANGATPVAGVGGCPAGVSPANLIKSSNFAAGIWNAPGKRTLFQCNGASPFIAADNPMLGAQLVSTPENASLVGGYGDCSTHPVLIVHSGSGNYLQQVIPRMKAPLSGWRFKDLRYTNTDAGTGTHFISQGNAQAGFTTYGIMQLRIEKLGMGSCDDYDKSENSSGWNELASSFSVHCEVVTGTRPGWAVQFGVGTRYGGFVNNWWEVDVDDGTGSDLNAIRVMGIDHTFFGHSRLTCDNEFPGANNIAGCSWQFRAAEQTSPDTGRHTQWNSLDNVLIVDENTQESFIYLSTGPRHGGSGSNDLDYHDLLWDRFVLKQGAKVAGREANFPVLVGTANVTLRNSIFNLRAHRGNRDGHAQFIAQQAADTANVPVTNPNFYNNLVVRGNPLNQNLSLCSAGTGVTGAKCRNNVIWDEDGAADAPLTQGYSCPGCAQSNNLHLHEDAGDCPFFGRTGACDLSPASHTHPATEFRLRSGRGGNVGRLVDQGFAFPESKGTRSWVSRDATLGRRGVATGGVGPVDIGPFERGSTP